MLLLLLVPFSAVSHAYIARTLENWVAHGSQTENLSWPELKISTAQY
jgi:hypothetical protein